MKREFKLLQQEFDKIIAINHEGGDPVMYLSGGAPMGRSLKEKINDYWKELGEKYGFKPFTVEGCPDKGYLYFLAVPTDESN